MPVFEYIAANAAERTIQGTLIADSPAVGRQRLREQGLRILTFAPARTHTPSIVLSRWRGRRARDEVAEAARYLALLLRAGVPLAEALDVLTRRSHGRLTFVLKSVRDRITSGRGLAEALAEHPRCFDSLMISAVRVGELTGSLAETLADLAESLETQEKLRGQLTQALTYPLILCVLGVGVVLFLMTRVIPQLMGVLAAAGRELPASTKLLKSASDFMLGHWMGLLLATAAAVTACLLAYHSERGKRFLHAAQLRVPVLGDLIAKALVARFAQQMAVLLKTGVPFLEAVRTVARLTQHRVLRDELAALGTSVEGGRELAASVSGSRVFPPVVVHLLAVGQDAGELPAMLAQLKTGYETEVRLALQRFVAVLEPLLIVLLAGGIGFVVFACLMPILEATRTIQ